MTVVGITEIAKRLNVKADTVQKWRSRHDDFPRPILNLAAGPVWDWSHIEAWAEATGRLERT